MLPIKTYANFIILGALVAGAIGLYFYISSLKGQVDSLTKENISLTTNNKILQKNNEILKDNSIKFAKANEVNASTVKSLLAERQDSIKLIADLALSKQKNLEQIATLNSDIDAMIKDPKNDGPVAPVLKETVRAIQNSRK
jgi:hypothetical protein